MLSWKDGGNLPAYCEPQNHFLLRISSTFNTCIPTNLALLSTLLGSLSILAWLFAQLPQIYKNYRLKSTAGLSIYFLVEWCLGDSANLAGAILTDQALWQIIIGAYYTFVDCALVVQFFYFTHYRRKLRAMTPPAETPPRPGRLEEPESSTRAIAQPIKQPRRALDDFRFPGSISPLGLEKTTPGASKPFRQHPGSSPLASPSTVLTASVVSAFATHARASPIPTPLHFTTLESSENLRHDIGQLVSWASTALYLGSRLPQLHKNWKRQSTSGLSISLFVAAFFGNLFYSASLLANPLAWDSYPAHGLHGWVGSEASDRVAWVKLALPFFLGAAGVLILDAAMALQFWIYGEGKRGPKLIAVPDEDGQKHWERVNGWMRGFIPSPALTPRRFISDFRRGEGEDSRSLLGRTPPGQHDYGTTTSTQ